MSRNDEPTPEVTGWDTPMPPPAAARSIHSDSGTYVLAKTEEDARSFAEAEGYVLGADVGWMHEVGWDADTYDSREQFERESGHSSWWEGCLAPTNDKQREHAMRAWEATTA